MYIKIQTLIEWENYVKKNRANKSNLKNMSKYSDHIRSCMNKNYDKSLVLHRHHIIPKSLFDVGDTGINDKLNLIYLSVEDHIIAHILYAKAYNKNTYEYISNMRSARLLNKKSVRDVDTLNEIAKCYIGKNNPFYNKRHSEKTKAILSKSTRDRFSGVDYNARYDTNATLEKEKRRLGVRKSWENMSPVDREIRRKNISNAVRKNPQVGSKNSWAMPVMVNDVYYGSITEATKALNVSNYILNKHYTVIKLGRKNEKST